MAKVGGRQLTPWSLRLQKVRGNGRWEAGPAPHTQVCARTCRASPPPGTWGPEWDESEPEDESEEEEEGNDDDDDWDL